MRQPTNNRITQTSHLASKAVDHSASPDPTIYAPVSGVIDSFQNRGTGTSSAGLMLRLKNTETGAMHSFGHCELSYVSVGQRVVEGQKLAKMGYTGYTIPSGPAGSHLHYYIRLADGTYVYPPSIYLKPAPTNTTTGEPIMTSAEEANAYKIVLNRVMEHNGSGRTGYQFITAADAELKAQRTSINNSITALNKNIADLQTALANEKNKPAEVVTREIEKIVERIVNVEVPVEVIKEVNPTWLEKSIEFIRSVLRIK